MPENLNRRLFLKSTALMPVCAAAGGALGGFPGAAQAETKRPGRPVLKTSLNAYSFNKMLNDSIKGRGAGITLVQVMEFAAKNKFEGFDATGYFFPGYPAVPTDAYIDNLEARRRPGHRDQRHRRAEQLHDGGQGSPRCRREAYQGICGGRGKAGRARDPRLCGHSDARRELGNVSNHATRDQVQDWIAAALKECADHGKKYGVRIGVQNHGDFLKTGDELMRLVKAVGSEWCGPIVDTGYFKTSDPYEDITLVAPHALNWQVKQSPSGEESEVPTDLIKLMRIVRKSGYSGYLPIETFSPRGKEYDPFTVVPAFLKQLKDAIAKTA